MTPSQAYSVAHTVLALEPHVHACTLGSVCAESQLQQEPIATQEMDGRASLRHLLPVPSSVSQNKQIWPQQVMQQGHALWRQNEALHALTIKRFTTNTKLVIIRKLAHEHVHLWDAKVAPALACRSMLVESWLHGPGALSNTCNPTQHRCIVNGAGAQFNMTMWTVMQDHSKWAVCCDASVACMGDMNREAAQRFRAGLAVCLVGTDGTLLHKWLRRHATPKHGHCLGCECYAV